MKADRTVIVVGAFLFLVGLAVAWNGYGYVQVERGWTLVISGTIGFCTGLILIALGLALRRLEAIASSASKSALFLAKVKSSGLQVVEAIEPALDQSKPLESKPVPVAIEAEEAEKAEKAEEDEGAPFAPWTPPRPAALDWTPPRPAALDWTLPEQPAPVSTPESQAPKAPVWMTRASSYASAFAAAKTVETPAAPAPETPRQSLDVSPQPSIEDDGDWLEQAIAREAATAEDSASASLAQPEAHPDDERDAKRRSALFGAPFHQEPAPFGAPVRDPEPFGAPIRPDHEEPEPEPWFEPEFAVDAAPEADKPDIEAAPEPEPEAAPEPAPPAELEQAYEPEPEGERESELEPEALPAVIGSYDAHGTHYTMYADGSIDAETAHGVYRFGSMEELKRFIEKS